MKNRKRKSGILPKTAAIMIAVSLFAGIFLSMQFRRYEEGVLDVCAVQQDGYVQLVLDQISLKENRSDEDMIRNILGTLDKSASRYWTFSRGENMLFVKDVLETNKYKGLTADSYFAGKSASAFISSLEKNRVTHAAITLDEKKYIASGVRFTYKGNDYRLVLLTNQSVILDNNKYLGAKTATITLITALLILLILVPMLLAWRNAHLEREKLRTEETVAELDRALAALNEKFSGEMLYRNSRNTWNISLLPEFLQRLRKRKISAVTVRLSFTGENDRTDFIRNGSRLVDRKFLMFEKQGQNDQPENGRNAGEKELILLFAGVDPQQVKDSMRLFSDRIMEIKENTNYGSQALQGI